VQGCRIEVAAESALDVGGHRTTPLGDARPEERRRVIDAGCQLFLVKPAKLDELIAGIATLTRGA
jgi:DNA-binding NarL/FixJ family response regulator